MSLTLLKNEVCHLSGACPYNQDSSCNGAQSNRERTFTCDYVVNGKITESGSIRNENDQTGRMKVILG